MKKLLIISMIAMSSFANAANIYMELDLRSMSLIQKQSVEERRDHDFMNVLFDNLVKKNIYVVKDVGQADYIVEGEAVELSTRGNVINALCGRAKYQIQARIYKSATMALVGLAKATASGITECAEDASFEGQAERRALKKFYKVLEKELKRVAR